MTGKIRYKMTADGEVAEYILDGKAVSKVVFEEAFPDREVGSTAVGMARSRWPYASVAAGCHPKQVAEAQAHAAKVGVPTEYTSDGKAVFRSRQHRKAFLRAHNMRDNDGSYGD